MADWAIVYGGATLTITGRAPYDVISVEGIGTAPARRLVDRSPFQDGDTDVGYRVDARLINLVLLMIAPDLATADTYRDALYAYLRPLRNPLVLRCTRDDGSIRQIQCHPVGVVDAPITEEDRQWGNQKLAVQLRAADPIWYNPAERTTALGGATGSGTRGFVVPMPVPMVQATATKVDVIQPLIYLGTWDSYPVITVTGPGTGVTITNVTSGEVLDFPSLALGAGEYIEIDLRYGAKTIVDDAGANQIAELSDDSDLATWRLLPDPDAPGGINEIHFEVASNATDATALTILYYDRYSAL